jgi:hypothetical protein
MRERYEMEV